MSLYLQWDNLLCIRFYTIYRYITTLAIYKQMSPNCASGDLVAAWSREEYKGGGHASFESRDGSTHKTSDEATVVIKQLSPT